MKASVARDVCVSMMSSHHLSWFFHAVFPRGFSTRASSTLAAEWGRLMASYSNHTMIEPDAYLRYYHDGLLDIFVGMTLVLFAVFMFVELPWLIAIWAATIVPIWMSVKKSLIAPRLRNTDLAFVGRVGDETARMRIAILVGMALFALLGVFTLWLVQSASIPSWFIEGLREYLALVLGLFAVLALGLIAALMMINRFYLYALLTALVFVAGYLLHAEIPLIFAIDGGIVGIAGVMVLTRFLRTHPIQNGSSRPVSS